MKRLAFLVLFLSMAFGAFSQTGRPARLKRIYFNLYTDSIKTILNYYVNVEGEYSDGRILPLDAASMTLSADHGSITGSEWVPPKHIDFEKVRFRAVANDDPGLQAEVTVWLKRAKDPRDEMSGNEMDLPEVPEELRKRRR